MRNRALHDALREFALEAAALLVEDQKNGAELEFEVVDERGRRGPSLYRYVPLTDEFIGERWERLRSLPSCRPAAHELGTGAAGYLSLNGIRGDDPEPALRAMLERIYEDATGFGFPEERFEAVYADVERTLYRDSTRARVVAPLRGVEIEAPRVDLGDGLSLARADRFEGPLQAGEEASTLCVLERDTLPGDAAPTAEAGERFRLLVFGLRLFKAGAVSLGSVGWTAADGGRWQTVALDGTGVARGEPWMLPVNEEAELREFLSAAWRSTHGGAVAWALGRFEMGCSRELDSEALSDYLLALRALLDAHTEAGLASLSLRLAALCAEEDERRVVQRHVELALSLERYLMTGGSEEGYLESVGSESPRVLVDQMERHLRALLRDVICGYLDPDLKGVADDILLRAPEPVPAPEPPPPARREAITTELEAVEGAALQARRITGPSERPPHHAAGAASRARRRSGRRLIPAAQALFAPTHGEAFAPTHGEAFAQEVFERHEAIEEERLEAERQEAERAHLAAEMPEAEPPEAEPEAPPPESPAGDPGIPEAEPPELEPDPEPAPEEADPVGHLDGVTPSADWDDYSAPV